MEYLLFAVVLATLSVAAVYLWRSRRRNPARSVHSFERALKALDPDDRKARRTR